MSEKFPSETDAAARRAFTLHDRLWQSNHYVYPVVSRRAHGVSIGINLNPDKACNFDCVYCSVDRKVPGPTQVVDLPRVREELAGMLELVRSGDLYRFDPFDAIPAELRRVNDIAFSGDGEPTTCPQFLDAVRLAAQVRDGVFAEGTRPKLVLITNATMFHRPAVREALAFLDSHEGEIWAKLDAGTEEYYREVDRTAVPFARVLENLVDAARVRPMVIQSLFMRIRGAGPGADEIAAYVGRLREITEGGGRIALVQVYTVARAPAEGFVAALTAGELEAIAAAVRGGVEGVAVEVFG